MSNIKELYIQEGKRFNNSNDKRTRYMLPHFLMAMLKQSI